jgi:hypothetical protein
MEVVSKSEGRPNVFDDEELVVAVNAMADGVLASVPKSRRRTQNRLYAFRAMERLGLLEESELERTLADRPALRWLVNEEGARRGIPAELGASGTSRNSTLRCGGCLSTGPRPKRP